ncbi:putative reverse transcriptase domain-containing protein [Tanacetum coccineum]
MMTARKRVGPLPTHRLAVRHSVDYSSLDHFSLDDSSSSSSSENSSDSSADSLSDSTSSHSSSDHSLPLSSSGTRSSHQLCSLVPSVHHSPVAIPERPSHDSSSVSPSRKRSRSPVASIPLSLIVVIGQQSADMVERILELERDNRRLRDIMDVESQRVTQFWCRVLRVQRETMPNTRSGASRTREGVNEQSDRWMAEALRARDAVRNLGPLMGDEDGQEEVNGNRGNGNILNGNGGNGNGGNGNRGNRNGNRNGGGYGYNFRGFMLARECTYQDFLKCQPLNFNGTEGVFRLTHYTLTWWNSYKRTTGIEATYAMSWAELMKLMTEVYCPRNEVQKMETELWNLAVKGNDLTAYTRRFQELVLLCTRMVLNKEDKVERFVGGLPDNIQENVIATAPTQL